eukprot:TRINITY_DN7794_c0_g1_i1.p1 TRINITY_DN7794_c0_g1~~TRINITY_DN7794_c0_g1_i1.p1  ORF type:complete len:546 (-),score=97.07 TRINITY_DN7794_c0_g1_i1:781-2418(-)
MFSLARSSRFSRIPSLLKQRVQARNYYTWAEPTAADSVQYPPEDVFRAGVRHHHICNTAWPIAHNTTIRPYRVPRLRDQKDIKRVLNGAFGSLNEMMLYVHIPFCQTRCQFCEYTVVDPKQGKLDPVHNSYVNALMDEFRLYDEVIDTKSKKLIGFDIGGGTPSMPHWKEIERVMDAAHKHFKLDLDQVEVSIETTPKIAATDPEKIRAYRKMGIRRISMGVQTTDFKQAKTFGRDDANASTDYLFKSVENIRAAGFESFNIDLMYGFPLSKRGGDPWLQTVQDTIALNPNHITLYRMRYKGTKMAHLMNTVDLQQVNEQEGAARAALNEAGYASLVGKNTFSKNGTGCSDYLDKRVVRAVPYIGYGLGAQSFSHHSLQYNLGAVTKRMEQYIKSLELGRIPVQDLYHLSKPAAIAKMASVSFYYGGIDKNAFNEAFEADFEKMFPEEIRFLSDKKLMRWEGDRFQMTMLGKKHFGGVVSQFYSPSVKEHIINLKGGEIFSEDVISKVDKINAATDPTGSYVKQASTNSETSFLGDRATKNVPSA